MFEKIPNKVSIAPSGEKQDVWPALSDQLEINLFYREFISAEGWIGSSYFVIWPREDVQRLRSVLTETFTCKYHFFGSNGGGTQFGFFENRGKFIYVSAPDIGNPNDIKQLGSWLEFMDSLMKGDYI